MLELGKVKEEWASHIPKDTLATEKQGTCSKLEQHRSLAQQVALVVR